MEKCIYCNKTKKLGKSHIVPECLGAKLKLLNRICNDCNHFIGRTIEAKICRDFSFYRYLAQIRTNKGKDVTTPAELQVMGNKVIVHIGEGGKPRFVPPIVEVKGNKKRFLVVAESPDKLNKYTRRFKEMGIQFEYDRAKPITVNLISSTEKRFISSDDYLRVATKIAFEFLCHEYPLRAISDGYEKVKQYIRFGKYENEKPARLIYEDGLVNNVLALPFPLHSILLFGYERMVGSIISIFGLFYYFVLLSDDNRILQNWTSFIYFNPRTGESRVPLLKHNYSRAKILNLIRISIRDPDVELKAQKYSSDKIDEILKRIELGKAQLIDNKAVSR